MRTSRAIHVKRDRPGALAWAVALVVTMLVIYMATLSMADGDSDKVMLSTSSERVTQEVAFAELSVYCAQFGSFADAAAARIEAARYVERGAAGYVHESGGKYLVLGAGYAQRPDAERVAARLAEEEEIACAVYSLEASPVKMRITAAQDQIEAIIAADTALRAQVDQLGELAFQLDRGEIRVDAARTLIAVQASQVRDVRDALKAIGGQNSICEQLTSQVETLCAALELLSYENAGTDLLLSGKIKYNYIGARLDYIEFLRGLN